VCPPNLELTDEFLDRDLDSATAEGSEGAGLAARAAMDVAVLKLLGPRGAVNAAWCWAPCRCNPAGELTIWVGVPAACWGGPRAVEADWEGLPMAGASC
jgi:hypothetical protein